MPRRNDVEETVVPWIVPTCGWAERGPSLAPAPRCHFVPSHTGPALVLRSIRANGCPPFVLTRISWVWLIIDSNPQVEVTASTERSPSPESSSPSSTLAWRLEAPAKAPHFLRGMDPSHGTRYNVYVCAHITAADGAAPQRSNSPITT